MFTKDENEKPEGEGDFQLSFLGSSSNERAPLLSRDNPNIVGHNPVMVHQFTRIAPQPQHATLIMVDVETEYSQPEAPVFRPSQKEIDDLTPTTQTSLADRFAAVTEIYGGRAIPISASEEELKFSPVTPWESEEFDVEDEAPAIPTTSHHGSSLQEDLKREILTNAELLLTFSGLYREAHAEYILAKEQYCNSKRSDDLVKLQRKEMEINLMSKPIIMAEKMQKLLSDTLWTLERHEMDRGYEAVEKRKEVNKR